MIGFFAAYPATAEMRRLQTEHYIMHTDVESELADDLGRRMDRMFDEYADRLDEFASAKTAKRREVYIFANRADYIALTKNAHSAGGFSEAAQVLAATLIRNDRDYLRRTLQHEAFHQFAHYTIGPNMPVWLNEGLACVFQEGIFTGTQFTIGQAPPWRVRLLQADIASGRLVDFKEFLRLDNEAWARNMSDESRSHSQYTQAWAMAHFLVFAADDEGNFKFRTRVIDMLRELHKGSDGMAAFSAAFGENIAGFQRRFVEYAKELRPTPEATYVERQANLAELLARLAAEGKEFTNVPTFREFVIKNGYEPPHRDGEAAWAAAVDMPSYFQDVSGHQFDSSRMFFEFREGAPIRDLVCRPSPAFKIRTRFFRGEGKCQHETIVEVE
jgi:hypothetical protein